MSQKLFLNTGRETTKGGALHALKDSGNFGAYDFATLVFTSVVVDQEVFKLGDDSYEFNVVTTDTAAESVAVVEVGDTSIVFDTAPSIAFLPGDAIRMETEFMVVIDYNPNGPSANVVRGAFGSTEAEHSIANSDTFQAAQPVVAGYFAVPVSDTDESVADAEIAAAVQWWSDGGYSKGLGGGIGVRVQNGLKVDAINSVNDSVVFAYPADGGVASTSDGLDSVTVSFTDGGTGEDYFTSEDGTDFLALGITAGEDITIAASVANDGTYEVLSVDAGQVNVATASWTDEAQDDAITIEQEDALTNATLTAFAGGVEVAGQVYSKIIHKVTAADVSDDQVVFFAPFVVDEAFAIVMDSTGVQLIWDGTVSVAGGRVVTFNNGGSVDPAAGDTIVMTMYG